MNEFIRSSGVEDGKGFWINPSQFENFVEKLEVGTFLGYANKSSSSEFLYKASNKEVVEYQLKNVSNPNEIDFEEELNKSVAARKGGKFYSTFIFLVTKPNSGEILEQKKAKLPENVFPRILVKIPTEDELANFFLRVT